VVTGVLLGRRRWSAPAHRVRVDVRDVL